MTIDIARLGIEIDSKQAGQAAGELDKLTAAGKRTEQASQGVERGMVKASSAAGKLRMEDAALNLEIERQIKLLKQSALTAQARAIAEQRVGKVVTNSMAAQRAGAQQLAYQIGDVGTQFSLGARPMQIFAAQGTQVVGALSLMRGTAGGLVGFLAGPWGIALTAAATVVGTLAVELIDLSDAADDAREALEKAFDRFDKALPQASALSQAMTEGGKAIQVLGKEARDAQGQIADLQAQIDNAAPGNKAALEAFIKPRIEAAQAVVDARQEEIRDIEEGIRARIEEARVVREQSEKIEAAEEKRGSAKRTVVKAKKEELTETEKQILATDKLIEQMALENEEIGKTAKELRLLNDERAIAAAVTDEQKKKIRELADERERLLGIEASKENAKKRLDEETKAAKKAIEEEAKLREDATRDLARMYEDLFLDGTGNIWDAFKRQGIAIISEIAAQWTLALLSGKGSQNFGAIANSVFGGQQGGALASIFGGGKVAANDNSVGGAVSRGGVVGQPGGLFTVPIDGGPVTLPDGTKPPAAGSLLDEAGVAIAASVVGNMIGGGGGNLGQLGSMIGSIGGQALGSSIAALGAFGGPVGAIAGAVLGTILGGALSGTKRGSVTLGGGGITGSRGNSSSRIQAATGSANSILGILDQIADAIGADINTSAGAVSIGVRNGNFRVDTSGSGITKTKNGAINFGADEQSAIEFAVRDLIRDGVLTGISAASQRLLRGGELEAQIEKVVLIESIPRLLKERLDPLGFALDQIDDKFRQLADALREGGATAEQFAEAEQLYRLERQDAIEQFGETAAQLKDFLDSLNFGGNSPLSLRQQLSNAAAALAPFEQKILAGETIDQAAFTSAAQSFLSLSRATNASSGAFFSDFDRIQSLTQQAIGNVESGQTIPGEAPDIFGQQTASNTADIANILGDQTALLLAANDNLAQIGALLASGGLDWLRQSRSYA